MVRTPGFQPGNGGSIPPGGTILYNNHITIMEINVYSTQTCPFCYQLKDFLTDNGFEFNDIDISQDEEAAKKMIKATGQMGVPVTEIDNEFIIGFDVEKLKQKLNIK